MEEHILIESLSQGSLDAYKQLFHKYYSPLCEYASLYLSDEDAEDLVQDFMILLWEQREILIHVKTLEPYLFASIRNRCLNAIEKEIYRQRKHQRFYEVCKQKMNDTDFYLSNELIEEIQKAINNLPTDYQKVFSRSRFSSKTNQDIAKELGISVKTVEYRITQSLRILRKQLKDFLSF